MKIAATKPIAGTEDDGGHSRQSSLRASIVEHLFVGELLRCLWRRGVRSVELLRAEVDAGGYDLVIECNGVTRHVQVKSSYRGARTRRVNVNVALASKLGGCVVWIKFDPKTMRLGPYLWLGGPPGQPIVLGELVGRHTRGPIGAKRDRPNIRIARSGQFTTLYRMSDLIARLFGTVCRADLG